MKLYALNLFKTENLQNLEDLGQIPKVLPTLDWDGQIKFRGAKSHTLPNASPNICEILVKHRLQNPSNSYPPALHSRHFARVSAPLMALTGSGVPESSH